MTMRLNKMSLKSRLIILMVLVLFIIFSLVLYAQYINSEASARNVDSSKTLSEISQSLAKINGILQILEKEIYEQLVNADKDRIDSINHTHRVLVKQITSLINNKELKNFIYKNKSDNSTYIKLNNLSLQILSDIKILKPAIDQFNNTTISVKTRYPAMSIFNNLLLPTNEKILLALTQAITEEPEYGQDLTISTKIEILFREAQYAWILQTQEVRLFISNRSGIFGNQEISTSNNLKNREIYISKFVSILDKLTLYDKSDQLGLIQTVSLNDTKDLLKNYNTIFERAKNIHLSDNWRMDLVILEDIVQPQLDFIWEKMVNLQKIIAEQSQTSILLSQNTTNQISLVIWYSAAIIIFVLAVVYFAFEFNLRRPIVSVAKALDAEARGEAGITFTGQYSAEINSLLNAFSNMRQQVQARQTRLQSILDNALEGIVITNEEGLIESFNNAAQALFQYTAEEVIDKNVSMLIPDPHAESHGNRIRHYRSTGQSTIIGKNREIQGVKKNNEVFPVSIKVNEMVIDGKRFFTAVVEDISERKALIDDLQFQATHDALTGLYNRAYFTNELEKAVNIHLRGDSNKKAIIYLDLDNFKYVNDTMGHLAGDQLIIEVSALLNNRVRKTDVLARLGGDEFAILLHHKKDIQLEYVTECFRKILSDCVFKYEGHIVDISCSIGAAYLNDEIKTKEQLLVHADFACHEAKRLGRNQVYIYTKEDDSQVSDMGRDIGWTRRIKEALAHDNFILACQPIYDTQKDSISYYEVLLRMTEDDNKIIMPFGFIPAAERFGLMLEIDAWVIHNAIKLFAAQCRFNPNLKFSINLSAHSIDNDSTFGLIKNAIEHFGVNPKNILFEVTETVAIANLKTATDLLSNIQSLGCQTALDDFGVGYSSFAYLADLPVDVVKIDGFFVKDMAEKSLNKTMVRAINDIAHELGKTTVAEFVENEACYNLLKELKVDYSQGYHLGKPEIVYDNSKNIEDLFIQQNIQLASK